MGNLGRFVEFSIQGPSIGVFTTEIYVHGHGVSIVCKVSWGQAEESASLASQSN